MVNTNGHIMSLANKNIQVYEMYFATEGYSNNDLSSSSFCRKINLYFGSKCTTYVCVVVGVLFDIFCLVPQLHWSLCSVDGLDEVRSGGRGDCWVVGSVQILNVVIMCTAVTFSYWQFGRSLIRRGGGISPTELVTMSVILCTLEGILSLCYENWFYILYWFFRTLPIFHIDGSNWMCWYWRNSSCFRKCRKILLISHALTKCNVLHCSNYSVLLSHRLSWNRRKLLQLFYVIVQWSLCRFLIDHCPLLQLIQNLFSFRLTQCSSIYFDSQTFLGS